MDDAELIRRFEDRTLSLSEWTHRAHVKVAYLYLRRYGFDGALARLRANIRALNQTNAIPDTPTSGYNETTTHALLHLIGAVIAAYQHTHPVTTAESFCEMHPQLLSKHVLRFFYSPQQRMHPDAKAKFIEPDLAALPRIVAPPSPEQE